MADGYRIQYVSDSSIANAQANNQYLYMSYYNSDSPAGSIYTGNGVSSNANFSVGDVITVHTYQFNSPASTGSINLRCAVNGVAAGLLVTQTLTSTGSQSFNYSPVKYVTVTQAMINARSGGTDYFMFYHDGSPFGQYAYQSIYFRIYKDSII
jgi:hypothetical protein